MGFTHSLGNTRYTFADLRDLLAKATPHRSGDVLAGVAAESAEQRVAAQCALADVALARFLSEEILPYETDEVTRLIVDSHDAEAFAPAHATTLDYIHFPRKPPHTCRLLYVAAPARPHFWGVRGLGQEPPPSKLPRINDLAILKVGLSF